MATKTKNYGLNKHSPDDFYSVEARNENWDKIDEALASSDPSKAAAKSEPADGDGVMLSDSAASGGLKRLSWAAVKTALGKVFVPISGGTLTGNLTGKYISGTWLQATAATDLSRTPGKVAVMDDSGWIYYRTVTELLDDLGIPDAASIRATTAVYGTTKLSTSITSTSKTTAATPYAVKAVLDKAKQYTDEQIKAAINSSY